MLATVTAVIPMIQGRIVDSAAARTFGHRHLSGWLADIEKKWAAQANKAPDGTPRMTLSAQIDHLRKLTGQANAASTDRVLYSKAGTRLSAALLRGPDAIVDTKAYWASVQSLEEGHYLIAVLNSAAALAKISDLQGIGEAGTKRDFDNLVWTLPIPEYDEREVLHRDLAAAALRAEMVAASVPLTDAQHFTAKRRAIRNALAEDGVAAEIEVLVDALLPT
jgi:hypothetical protein